MATEKQFKTFLSYSRDNKDFALKLARELKAEGFYVWLDLLDIAAGSRWDVEVEKALEACEIFMIIMTPTAIASENVRDEIGYAIDTGKRILPVLLENCAVPLRLRRFQYVDFTTKSFDEGVESAKELLRNLIAQTSIPRREVPAEPQDPIAQAEAELPKAKEDPERIAKRKLDNELAVKARAESERKAKEEADRLAARNAEAERKAGERAAPVKVRVEPVSTSTTQTKPDSNGLVIGIVVFVLLVSTWLGYNAIAGKRDNNPPTEPPVVENPPTEAPAEPEVPVERIQIRWFVGLGVGSDENMIPTEQEVVDDFNNSQDRITLTLDVVPYDQARDTLAPQFASGDGPDIIGPVGWGGSHTFYGQWLDLSPYISEAGFDTSIFDPVLIEFYRTDEGQVSLPFDVFPAAIYYIPAFFDEAGLNYPPSRYGENYVLDGNVFEWNLDTLSEVARRLTIDANGFNSTQSEFDRDQIIRVGFHFQWQDFSPNHIGSYRVGAATIVQNNQSVMPDQWREALRWYYDGIWGFQPFMATGVLANTPEFGNGNIFNGGRAAMAVAPIWYTCCLTELANSGMEFQVGILPSAEDGQVHGRTDADSFRIWKGTPHPQEAFEVFSYLITTGGDKLLPLYDVMSAIPFKNQDYFNRKSQQYPFVSSESWDVFQASLAFPDIPSAEQYQPNYNEAVERLSAFMEVLKSFSPSEIDFDTEWQSMVDDLNAIYNR
jgi:multiple sugar transport system substrate-binding protein